MVFQFYHLLPELTTLENILAPALIAESTLSYWRRRGAHRRLERAADVGRNSVSVLRQGSLNRFDDPGLCPQILERQGRSGLQGLAIVLGTLLCIIPGIIFAVMYTVAVPVAIEERPGASQAMTRSAELTDGHRWDVFFVLAALFLLGMGLVFAAGLLAVLNKVLEVVLTLAVKVLATGLSATAYTVMYYRLRSVKESLDVDQIASVFD